MKYLRTPTVLVITLIACFAPASPAGATDTSFKQRILPLNCVFQTIDAGTGTLFYVTPEACGALVTPPTNSPVQSAADNSGSKSNAAAKQPTSTSPSSGAIDLGALLRQSSGSQSAARATIVASPGQMFSFIINVPALNDGKHLKARIDEQHTIAIDSVNMADSHGPAVTITIHSNSTTAVLHQNETIMKDASGDGMLDLGITAEGISASTVKLELWQIEPGDPSVASAISESALGIIHATIWRVVAIATLLVAGCAVIYVRMYRKPKLASKVDNAK